MALFRILSYNQKMGVNTRQASWRCCKEGMALDTVIIRSPESDLHLGSPGYKKGTTISHLLLEESRNKKEMIELYLHLKRRAGVPGGSVRWNV